MALIQESEGGCDELAGCKQYTQKVKNDLLAATADSEKCDKNDAKLTSRIADQAARRATAQGKLSKSKRMLSTLLGSMSHDEDLGEAANVAADAAIESARAEIAAHKLARGPHQPEELRQAVDRATKAKSDQVMAELRVTQAAALA